MVAPSTPSILLERIATLCSRRFLLPDGIAGISFLKRDLVARLDKRVELLREDLEANWDRMSESTREERKAAINALAEKRDQLKEQFQQLSQRSGKAWDELKSGFVRSYRALTADEATASGDETADTEAAN